LLFNPTFTPFAAVGLGVAGVSGKFALDAPGPRGLGEPYECLLVPFNPPPIAFCNKGLVTGEKGDPDMLPELGLPFRDRGDSEYLSLLPGEPLIGVGVLAYLGGVM
jgi:hypothetical protein